MNMSASASQPDVVNNLAEMGTNAMEFIEIGRLLRRKDMSDAGSKIWTALNGSEANYQGLFCQVSLLQRTIETREEDDEDEEIVTQKCGSANNKGSFSLCWAVLRGSPCRCDGSDLVS